MSVQESIAGTPAAGSSATPLPVDLRSDTVTRPTPAMYERMMMAEVGDDGLDGDPTARELEAVAAQALGKEAGLFVPSCTMANLLAVLAQSQRGEQVVVESSAHIYTSERGSGTLTGLFYLPVPGVEGAMDLAELEDALTATGHRLRTALVAMETSHNNAGGAVLPLAHMRSVRDLAHARGARVHLDGARLFNAAVSLNVRPAEIAQFSDTVSLCLSKGLSAPVGAVLAGPKDVIARSRPLRRMLGGAQRQIGIMAAAGLEGVRTMGPRLIEDHRRARRLSEGINALASSISASTPQTNIIQIDVSRSGRDSTDWVGMLEKVGLLARPWGRHRLRCVTHREINDAAIERAISSFAAVLQQAHPAA